MSGIHYNIFPLGDQAMVIEVGAEISEVVNDEVLRLLHYFGELAHPFIVDLVPAYASLGIYYDVPMIHQHDPNRSAFAQMAELVSELLSTSGLQAPPQEKRLIRIPVCYGGEYGPDLEELSSKLGLSWSDIIAKHTGRQYRVYMLGYLPGFSYMGKLDPAIVFPRRETPRIMVPSGSVGIAGEQTGIYPSDSPGGWQIIGRTPYALFDPAHEMPVLLHMGDYVEFYQISEDEFRDIKGGAA